MAKGCNASKKQLKFYRFKFRLFMFVAPLPTPIPKPALTLKLSQNFPFLLESTGGECSKYGGCRLFLCKEFESININGDDIDVMAMEEQVIVNDWYRKSCDKCLKRISKRHHGIRQPLCHGGWRGCYCSFECMEVDINDDPQVAVMIGRMKEQLDVIGIRDY